MPSIVVRKLEKSVVDKLKKRAAKRGRSLEAETRLILEEAANSPQLDMDAARARIEELQERFKGRPFPDTADLIREDRDR